MLTLRDIMVTDVVAVDPDTTLRDAIALFTERRITGVPVVAHGRVIGVVATSDILDSVAVRESSEEIVETATWDEPGEDESWVEEGEPPPDPFFTELGPVRAFDELERFEELEDEPDVLTERTVEEVMTRALHALPPDTPVTAAAQYMMRVGIHRLLVVDGSRLIGVATTSDFMRAVAEGRLAESPVQRRAAQKRTQARRPA